MSTYIRFTLIFAAVIFSISSLCFGFFESFEVWQDLGCSHQCHGDADCAIAGPFWVSPSDLIILEGCLPLPAYTNDMRYNPAADFDRDFDVDYTDVAILETYINQINVPADCGKKLELDAITEECLVPDSNYTIGWNWNTYITFLNYVPPGPIQIYYSLDYGSTWTYVDTVSGSYSYQWTVPSDIRTHLDLKIVDTLHSGLTDFASWSTDCNGTIDTDYNGDCYVDGSDFAILALSWLEESGTDINDLNDLAGDWLKCNNPCDPDCNNTGQGGEGYLPDIVLADSNDPCDCMVNNGSLEYQNWLHWNKPDCWCYPRQCRGDIDGLKFANVFWVSGYDLTLFKQVLNRVEATIPPGGECADLDHKKFANILWVSGNDLAIFKQYLNQLESQVLCCDSNQDCTPDGVIYNFWTSP